MKTTLDLRPGDLIEYYYVRNGQSVKLNERIFSSAMTKWINVCGKLVVVSVTERFKGDYVVFINGCNKLCKVWYHDASPESGLSTVGQIAIRKICV
jgi:hypothetical protein